LNSAIICVNFYKLHSSILLLR